MEMEVTLSRVWAVLEVYFQRLYSKASILLPLWLIAVDEVSQDSGLGCLRRGCRRTSHS